MTNKPFVQRIRIAALVFGAALACSASVSAAPASVQQRSNMTARQMEIEDQRIRLGSGEVEDRRDAISRLGAMHHPDASRVALAGLRDPLPIVRATSASAILSLPASESAANLMPLLNDKDEFVRREVAYALGVTRSRAAVSLLIERLQTDKIDEVRGAAAVALGEIGDDGAVVALASVLSGAIPVKGKKTKKEQNPFVLRSAARSLGQIANRAGVPALIAALQGEQSESDVKRESAIALGLIGDASALPALSNALHASDPHLSRVADESIRKIRRLNIN